MNVWIGVRTLSVLYSNFLYLTVYRHVDECTTIHNNNTISIFINYALYIYLLCTYYTLWYLLYIRTRSTATKIHSSLLQYLPNDDLMSILRRYTYYYDIVKHNILIALLFFFDIGFLNIHIQFRTILYQSINVFRVLY